MSQQEIELTCASLMRRWREGYDLEGCLGGKSAALGLNMRGEGGTGGKGDISIFGLMQVEFEMGAWIAVEVAHVTGPSSSR